MDLRANESLTAKRPAVGVPRPTEPSIRTIRIRAWLTERAPTRIAILTAMPPRTTRLSSGVVVVRATDAGWRFLLLRAFNHWDFPKGMVEPDEEPLAAAIREVKEESLIEDLDFAWGHEYSQTGPYSRGKVARYYLARTQTEAVTLTVIEALGRPEHNEYRWVDLATAQRLISPRLQPVLAWAQATLDTAA